MSKASALAHAQTTITAPAPAATTTAAPTQPVVATPAAPAADPAAANTVPANLAKKEADIVRQRNEFKKEQAALAEQKKKYDDVVTKYQEFNELKAKDPIAALRQVGFTETEIFNYLAQAKEPELTPEQKAVAAAEAAASAKIKEFQDSQAEKDKTEAAARDQKTLVEFKGQISNVIKTNVDKFEYCAHEGAAAEALIYETVLQSVAQSGGKEYLSPEEAAQMVEEYYEERDKAMSGLKKRQPAPAAAAPAPTGPTRTRTVDPSSPGVAAAKATVQRSRTLSNAATATVASTTAKRAETPSEKRARLEAWLRDGTNPGKH